MTGSAKRIAGFSLIAAISVLAVACGESKVSQCNKLIEVANKAVGDVQEVTSSANPEDVNAMIKIADTADQAKATMETLEINDEQLQSFQQAHAGFGGTATCIRCVYEGNLHSAMSIIGASIMILKLKILLLNAPSSSARGITAKLSNRA